MRGVLLSRIPFAAFRSVSIPETGTPLSATGPEDESGEPILLGSPGRAVLRGRCVSTRGVSPPALGSLGERN